MKKITGTFLPALIFGSLGIFILQIGHAADPKLLGCWGNGKVFLATPTGNMNSNLSTVFVNTAPANIFPFATFLGRDEKFLPNRISIPTRFNPEVGTTIVCSKQMEKYLRIPINGCLTTSLRATGCVR